VKNSEALKALSQCRFSVAVLLLFWNSFDFGKRSEFPYTTEGSLSFYFGEPIFLGFTAQKDPLILCFENCINDLRNTIGRKENPRN
jgi:hypothetical protein